MEITFQGKPMTLCGRPLQAGDPLPDFTLTDGALQPMKPGDLCVPCVLLAVPSLDTGVCDQEVRRFNQAAAGFDKAAVYAVSLDLPFAQTRWCGGAGVDRVQALSDYKDHSFGKATGTRVEQLGLLTRAVFVIDGGRKVAYAQYVPEITDHPDYDACLASLRSVIR